MILPLFYYIISLEDYEALKQWVTCPALARVTIVLNRDLTDNL